MVTRHRVNLSFAESDYRRLMDAAAAEGKAPATFVADMVKAQLARMPRSASRRPQEVPAASVVRPVSPGLTRQQRRALERQGKKKAGR